MISPVQRDFIESSFNKWLEGGSRSLEGEPVDEQCT